MIELVTRVLYIFWIQVPYEIYNLQVFSPNPWFYLFIFLSTGMVKNTILAEIVKVIF